jgi:selenocysteine lyase/cysteine desulfurase
MSSAMNRREFARLFALGGSAALLTHPAVSELAASAPEPVRQGGWGPAFAAPLRPGDSAPDWEAIRARFLLPRELAVMNAANLCPSPRHVLDTVQAGTERLDREPVPSFRNESFGAKEWVRERLAAYLRATPEEILITRNTSESNNWISAGLELGAGDEVVIFSDNHPSNNAAWKGRAERHGFAVREVAPPFPHPGPEAYLDAFRQALTPATRVLAFTHFTNTAGDLLPATELCALARERGVLSVVDGAQSFGLLDVDLSRMRPDFYSGSAHKWPCGPKEVGVLYVDREVHDRFWPPVISAYPGRVGLSRTHEGMGQRDEAAIRAFGEQLDFLMEIGRPEIEARSRALTDAVVEGLSALDGVQIWTSMDPALRVAVVSFQPGHLDPRRVLAALEEDGVVAAMRGGSDRPGIRFSPHFYNSFEDVERGVAAIGRYLRTGL